MVNHMVDNVFLESNEIVEEFCVPITPESKKFIINYVRYKLGKPYSIKSIISIFMKQLNVPFCRFKDGSDSYICSELVAEVINASGMVLEKLDADEVTPKEIYDICIKHFIKITNSVL